MNAGLNKFKKVLNWLGGGGAPDLEMENRPQEYGIDVRTIGVPWFRNARRVALLITSFVTVIGGYVLTQKTGSKDGLWAISLFVMALITIVVLIPLKVASRITYKRRFHDALPVELQPVYANKVKTRITEFIKLFIVTAMVSVVAGVIVWLIIINQK